MQAAPEYDSTMHFLYATTPPAGLRKSFYRCHMHLYEHLSIDTSAFMTMMPDDPYASALADFCFDPASSAIESRFTPTNFSGATFGLKYLSGVYGSILLLL